MSTKKVITLFIRQMVLISVFVLPFYSQINYFNIYRPYQTTLCCPVNVYGLGIEMNYYLIDTQTAKLDIPISLYWGLASNFEVGFRVSGVSISSHESVTKGLSDIVLGTKYNFIKENKEELGSIPSISSELCVTLPTGNYKEGIGTGAIGLVLNWLLEKEFVLRAKNYFHTFLNLGYKINTENPDKGLLGNELFYSLGSYFNIKENLVFSVGLKGINHSATKVNGQKLPGTEKTESYGCFGLSYDFTQYQRFFMAIAIGIDEHANDIVVNIGMMY